MAHRREAMEERQPKQSGWAAYRLHVAKTKGTYQTYGAVPLQQNEHLFPEPARCAIETPGLGDLIYGAARDAKYGRKTADTAFYVRPAIEDERDVLSRSMSKGAHVVELSSLDLLRILWYESRVSKNPALVRSQQRPGSSLSHS